MTYRIYLSPPDVGELEEEFVLDALRSGWVAPTGPHVDAFEGEVAEFVGVKQAVATSSGTAALHLALMALDVGPGDEVVVPSMTFAATAFAVMYTGARPVFLDSEPESLNLDPELLRSFLHDRARTNRMPAAVIVVDIFGQTADYAEIIPVCAEFDVPIVEDAAESLGASHALGRAGCFGRSAAISFNGNKIMTTSGGGMFVTNDVVAAERVRHLATQARESVPWYQHSDVGYNYRLSNVLAALGRAQLLGLEAKIERRRSIRASYERDHGLRVLRDAPWGSSNAWLTLADVGEGRVDDVVARLRESDIEARYVWKPLHMQPVFADCESCLTGVAESAFGRLVCLPSGSALSSEDVEEIARLVVDQTG